MGGFSLGCGLGWTASCVEIIKNRAHGLGRLRDGRDRRGVFPVGAALGAIVIPLPIDKIGRKCTMMVSRCRSSPSVLRGLLLSARAPLRCHSLRPAGDRHRSFQLASRLVLKSRSCMNPADFHGTCRISQGKSQSMLYRLLSSNIFLRIII